MMALVLSHALMTAALPTMRFGPPIGVGGGGKMSNTLVLYPDGFGEAGDSRPCVRARVLYSHPARAPLFGRNEY